MKCGVCGGENFSHQKVLWAELVNDWQLSPAEVAYIDDQQGGRCITCGSNVRSIALGNAIRAFLGVKSFLNEALTFADVRKNSVLEINEAGTLSSTLRKFEHYTYGAYPEVDMHCLPYEDCVFDMVVHSDTLEHIPRPIHALRECLRVLKPAGGLCFTVPIIVGRLSRSREGLKKSYHGNSLINAEDYSVQTEFGADVWNYVMEAGFSSVSIYSFAYPAGISILAIK